MKCFWVSTGKPEGILTADQQKQFEEATTLFVGYILSVLGDRLVEVNMHMTDAKDLWDALNTKFGATDASNDLYIMEQFHDYRMADNRSVVEQAQEIQTMAKELELLKCVLPDKFVAGCIIAKLPPSWRSEKAREKDAASKGDGGQSSANVVHKAQNKSKGKYKAQQTTDFKKQMKNNNNPNQDERTCFVTRGSTVLMGNGSHASVHGVGTIDLKFTSGKIVQLKNVQHVPSIDRNLVSGSRLTRDGFKLVFESNKVVVSKQGYFIGKGSKCHSCVQSKQPHKPHKAAEERNLAPLELLHSDLCEMNGVLTKGGKRYFMTLIDDATIFCYVYLLKTKDEALDYFKIYKAEVENQLDRKIKRLRSDRGGEFFSNEFDLFCEEHGIIHERTPPYSPESNGIAERKNRTLTDLVNAMLETTGLPKAWWGEALLTSNHVLNRVPNINKDKTPYEIWIGRKPSLSYLRTWGCLAKVNVPITKKRKLGPKTVDCVFLGYAHHSIAYRFLIVKSEVPDMHVGTIMESRDATFFESFFPMKDTHSSSSQPSEVIPSSITPPEQTEHTHEYVTEEDVSEAPRRTSHSLLVHQMDVKTAFLNGELDEEIYMDQPDGFVVEGQEGKMCKLLKSLYGLKHAPKQWHEKFDKTLTSTGFAVNEADKCVYYSHGGGEGVILCLYVDDILIFGTNLEDAVIGEPSGGDPSQDLGVADVILNIKLIRGENRVTLLQPQYVEMILNRFGYIDSKPSPTPYDPSLLLRKNKRIARNQLEYSQIIGSLMYLASATRPDISFAVSKLSRLTSNPGDDDWRALERVMCYLKGTMELGLHYSRYPVVLEGYSDSNWIFDVDEIKATSGYVFTLGGGAVSWRSCKQTILTRSTMKAELTALDTATAEAEWLRDLLMDLPIVEKPVPAILMNYDNQTVIVKVNSSKDNMKSSRHVKRRLKSVRKLRNSGVRTLDYIQTARNLADPFTKGLSRNVIDNASKEMGLRPM
uniref:OSJNBb0045P24.6 protein n=1 Tax=Oryza sativa subsp. japonica TaxID=39947 RepID=Q7XWN4_ORYSJ|nr:OSJNBb0045P24.6 [Oryza sativa Japonica Group]